jgi:hypothetical protein
MNLKNLTTGLILSVVLFTACRKTDIPPEEKISISKEEKFFKTNAPTLPVINSIISFLERKNQENNFVNLTIERAGYPVWDKALIVNNEDGAYITESEPAATVYIPLVLPGEQRVNTALIVKVEPSDTVASFLSDWQYRSFPNKLINDTAMSAEKVLPFA